MWPYFLLIFVIFILQFEFSKKNTTSIRFYIGIVVLFIFAAFRGNGRGDYFAYLIRGAEIDTIEKILHNDTGMEIGYCFLYYLVNLFHLPAQCVIMAMNFISISCTANFIKKYSPYKCLSLLLFLPLYFQFDMHAARTAVAISISALSITYAYERKFIRFCFVVFLATLFHQTAGIVLAVYFLVSIRVNLYVSLGLILCAVGWMRFIGMDSIIISMLEMLGLNAERYITYVNSERYGYPFSLIDPRLLLMIFIFIVAKLFCSNADKLENLFINCCYANIMSMILLSEHTFICYRFSAFFNVYSIVLVPIIVDRLCDTKYYRNMLTLKKNRILAKCFVIFLFSIYAMAYVYTGPVASGTEYRLFFS